ncbi:hypothetical protein DFH09DRAFT_1073772 [Mycena vulgaris]|nr:hypothetical protein DFH09DRAFT_1073772 [Mycena vulgaris]
MTLSQSQLERRALSSARALAPSGADPPTARSPSSAMPLRQPVKVMQNSDRDCPSEIRIGLIKRDRSASPSWSTLTATATPDGPSTINGFQSQSIKALSKSSADRASRWARLPASQREVSIAEGVLRSDLAPRKATSEPLVPRNSQYRVEEHRSDKRGMLANNQSAALSRAAPSGAISQPEQVNVIEKCDVNATSASACAEKHQFRVECEILILHKAGYSSVMIHGVVKAARAVCCPRHLRPDPAVFIENQRAETAQGSSRLYASESSVPDRGSKVNKCDYITSSIQVAQMHKSEYEYRELSLKKAGFSASIIRETLSRTCTVKRDTVVDAVKKQQQTTSISLFPRSSLREDESNQTVTVYPGYPMTLPPGSTSWKQATIQEHPLKDFQDLRGLKAQSCQCGERLNERIETRWGYLGESSGYPPSIPRHLCASPSSPSCRVAQPLPATPSLSLGLPTTRSRSHSDAAIPLCPSTSTATVSLCTLMPNTRRATPVPRSCAPEFTDTRTDGYSASTMPLPSAGGSGHGPLPPVAVTISIDNESSDNNQRGYDAYPRAEKLGRSTEHLAWLPVSEQAVERGKPEAAVLERLAALKRAQIAPNNFKLERELSYRQTPESTQDMIASGATLARLSTHLLRVSSSAPIVLSDPQRAQSSHHGRAVWQRNVKRIIALQGAVSKRDIKRKPNEVRRSPGQNNSAAIRGGGNPAHRYDTLRATRGEQHNRAGASRGLLSAQVSGINRPNGVESDPSQRAAPVLKVPKRSTQTLVLGLKTEQHGDSASPGSTANAPVANHSGDPEGNTPSHDVGVSARLCGASKMLRKDYSVYDSRSYVAEPPVPITEHAVLNSWVYNEHQPTIVNWGKSNFSSMRKT